MAIISNGTTIIDNGSLASGVGGKVAKVSYAEPSNYTTTLSYSSTSLTPCGQITVTASKANSDFLINWSAEHARNGSGRSQYMITDAYTAGRNNYVDQDFLFYSHYGLRHYDTAFNQITSYSYYDNSQSLAVGASVTYYFFLGVIGAGTSDQANFQRIQVMEIAQ